VNGKSALYYLHGDQLGSVSLMTGATGNLLSSQEYKPWGEVRSGGVSQTTLNYTGQRKDDTGLLYYNSRFYDPVLARFTSSDVLVPNGAAVLIVDYHEPGSVGQINSSNQTLQSNGFPFQSGKSGGSSGPSAPQSLNRYSYVSNEPLKNIDPTGHSQDMGGRVYNHSKHRSVWVYGSIPFEEFQKKHADNCFTIDNCPALHTLEAQIGGWMIHDGTAEGNTGQFYVMGWFILNPGEDSFSKWGMVDADLIMAAPLDSLAYCNDDGGYGCDGTEPRFGFNVAEFKIANGDDATITDSRFGDWGEIHITSAGLLGGRDPWYAGLVQPLSPRGWRACPATGWWAGCRLDPYYYDEVAHGQKKLFAYYSSDASEADGISSA